MKYQFIATLLASIASMNMVSARYYRPEVFGLQEKLRACGLTDNDAAMFGDQSIRIDLLIHTPACDRYKTADHIVIAAAGNVKCIKVAMEYTNAEKNMLVNSLPRFCNDPSLPATPILRGILPLVDPATKGADAINAIAKSTLKTAIASAAGPITANPNKAGDKSIDQLMIKNGFTNFYLGELFSDGFVKASDVKDLGKFYQ
jgi:hypothetical protein